ITAPANLVDDSHPHGVAGAWESWKPAADGSDNHDSKKRSNFLGYLISDPSMSAPDPSGFPGGTDTQIMVGDGSLGTGASASRKVEAPLIRSRDERGRSNGALAWATLDEGVKGRVDLTPSENSSSSIGES